MFAAGRNDNSRDEGRLDKKDDDESNAVWLNVGKSFQSAKEPETKVEQQVIVYHSSSTDEDRHHRKRRKKKTNHNKKEKRGKRIKDNKEDEILGLESESRIKASSGEGVLFEFSTKRDIDNCFYGELYGLDAPVFTFGTTKVQGRKDQRVVASRPSTPHRRIEELKHKHSERYFSFESKKTFFDRHMKHLNLAYTKKHRECMIAQATSRSQMSAPKELAFIPLGPPITNIFSDGQLVAYTDNDAASGGLMTDLESYQARLLERTKIYNAKIMESPHDVGLWLDFIYFQDESFHINPSKQQRKAILDKQLTILEKATEKNPHSMLLVHVALNIRSQFNQHQEMMTIYEKVLAQYPEDFELWKRYITYSQKSFGAFSVESTRSLYAKGMASLHKKNIGKQLGNSTQVYHSSSILLQYTPDQIQNAKKLQELFLLACQFEMRLGYTEKAVALFQALIEFNLYCPVELLQRDLNASLDIFAKYWEAETPRFGENLEGRTHFDDWYAQTIRKVQPNIREPSAYKQALSTAFKSSLMPDPAAYEAHIVTTVFQPMKAQKEQEQLLMDAMDANQDESSVQFANSPSESSEDEEGMAMVYSIMHGYRIPVRDANEAPEYQRILNELEGSLSEEQKESRLAKKHRSREAIKTLTSHLSDDRVAFPVVSAEDEIYNWLHFEEAMCMKQWKPLRSTNPQDEKEIEQQPDRVIFFEELREHLFQTGGVLDLELIYCFLNLLGVAVIASRNLSRDYERVSELYWDDWHDESMLAQTILSHLIPHPGEKYLQQHLSSGQKIQMLEEVLNNRVQVSNDACLDPQKVLFIRTIFHEAMLKFKSDSHLKCFYLEYEVAVVLRVKKETLDTEQHRSHFFSIVQDVSKAILQSNEVSRQDLRIWETYARLVFRVGESKEGTRVCEKALSISAQMTEPRRLEAHRLLYLLVQSFYWQGKDSLPIRKSRAVYAIMFAMDTQLKPWSKVVKKCTTIGEESEALATFVTPLKVLATRIAYESLVQTVWQEMNESNDVGDVSTWCYMVYNCTTLMYMASGLKTSLGYIREWIAKVECSRWKQTNSHAWLLAAVVHLVENHAQIEVVAPKLYRELLGDCITHFPLHPTFLRLLVHAEENSLMSQRLRMHFQATLRSKHRVFDSPDPLEWLFAVLCEVSRAEKAIVFTTTKDPGPDAPLFRTPTTPTTTTTSGPGIGGSAGYIHRSLYGDKAPPHPCHHLGRRWGKVAVHRLRAVFERSVACPRSQGCPLLWRLYLRLEVSTGRVDQAKKLLHRAIHACPWSKALYLDSCRLLRPFCTQTEVQDILELMISKEVMLRIEPDAWMG